MKAARVPLLNAVARALLRYLAAVLASTLVASPAAATALGRGADPYRLALISESQATTRQAEGITDLWFDCGNYVTAVHDGTYPELIGAVLQLGQQRGWTLLATWPTPYGAAFVFDPGPAYTDRLALVTLVRFSENRTGLVAADCRTSLPAGATTTEP